MIIDGIEITEDDIDRSIQTDIDDVISSDQLKPSHVPFATLAREMVGKLPVSSLGLPTLVVCDMGLLSAYLQRIVKLRFDTTSVTYMSYDEKQSEFARSLGVNVIEFDIKNLNKKEILNKFQGMKFDVIIGNPPYNGIKRGDVKGFNEFLTSGYRTYYPFIALERDLLKDDGVLIYVTPHKWLTEATAQSLREEVFKDGKLGFLDVRPQPDEWNGKAQIGQVAVFNFTKNSTKHAANVTNIGGQIFCETNTLLQKIINYDAPKVELIPGCISRKAWDSGDPLLVDCIWWSYRRGGHLKKEARPAKRNEKRYNLLRKARGKKILVTSSFTNVPLRDIRGVIDPVPFSESLVGIATSRPETMKILLSSAVAKYVFTMFFNSKNFDKALNKKLPDITHLLPDNCTEDDVNRIFNLTQEEIEYVNELAKSYGKDM